MSKFIPVRLTVPFMTIPFMTVPFMTIPPKTIASKTIPSKTLHFLTVSFMTLFLASVLSTSQAVAAEKILVYKFGEESRQRWSYFSDQVMGGVSQGRVEYPDQKGESFAHMTGLVSTENNGGFIQIRRELSKGVVANASGVYLKVRGNSQGYFIHLRTSGTVLPWQYYQASFDTESEWKTIFLPFSEFKASSGWLRSMVKPRAIRSLGVVAYGRDHQAEIDVAEIGFYE